MAARNVGGHVVVRGAVPGGAQAIDTSCRFATVGFSVDSSFLPLKIACL